jgi:hypothetical protein
MANESVRSGAGREIRWRPGVIAALILMVTTASNANAVIVTSIFSGTITDGIDQGGLFGPAGTDLTGDAFTATVLTPITATDSGTGAEVTGAITYLPPTVSSVTIAISEPGLPASSYSFASNYLGGASLSLAITKPNSGLTVNQIADPKSTYSAYLRQVIGNEGLGASFGDMVELANGGAFPFSLTQSGTYSVVQDNYPDDFFGIETGVNNFHATSYAQGELNTTSLTIDVLSAPSPEPMTWALCLVGTGLVGASVRNSRRHRAHDIG